MRNIPIAHKKYLSVCGLLVSAAVGLTACGGGGSDSGAATQNGPSGPDFSSVGSAKVSSNGDAAEVAYAATEGVFQGVNSSNAGEALPLAGVLSEFDIREALSVDALELAASAESTANLPIGAVTTVSGDCGGSVTIDTGNDQIPTNGTGSFGYTYNDYCLSLGEGSNYIVSGTGQYEYTYRGGELIGYSVNWNLTYRITGEESFSSRVSGSTTCSFEEENFGCTYSDDFTAPNGETYRVENVSVSQNGGDGTYEVSARVYDVDVGYVDFEASSIGQCADGNFSSGTITITDSTGNEVVDVLFTNCNDCVVTFNGNSQTYSQPDRN